MTSKMQVLAPAGHYEVPWDTDEAATVEEAKRKFAKLISQRYVAARVVDEKPRRITERIGEFDPESQILMAPALAGG